VSRPTFADAFAAAVADRGLSLDRLHDRLVQAGAPVSVATLSYWRSGRSEPGRRASMRTLAVLEGVLGVAPGHLVRHVEVRGSAESAGPQAIEPHRLSPPMPPMGEVTPSGEIAQAIIDRWGNALPGRLTRLSVHDRIAVTDERLEGTQNTRTMLRADIDGVDSFPVVWVQDAFENGERFLPKLAALEGEDDDEANVVPLRPCRIGRFERVEERNLVVAEILFPEPLRAGQLLLAEYLLLSRYSGVPATLLQRGLQRPLRELVMEAHFHPDNQPTHAFRFVKDRLSGTERLVDEVPIHGGAAQAVFVDLQPSTVGLRWEWD